MSDSVWPHIQWPTRLPHPWDSPGKNTGVGCHFLLQHMKVKRESEVAQWCPTLSDPMDCSLPGSSVHGISRQEYWSGVPLPSLSHDLELPIFSSSLYLLSSLLLLFLLLISMSVCLSLPNPYLPMSATVPAKFPPFTQVLICWTPARRHPISNRKIYPHQ